MDDRLFSRPGPLICRIIRARCHALIPWKMTDAPWQWHYPIRRTSLKRILSSTAVLLLLASGCLADGQPALKNPKGTAVSIKGDMFLINGRPTYENRFYKGCKIEGLLFNARMVQGIFDDLNPATRELWKYPDTGQWDPDRNSKEFADAMPVWRGHGLNAFSLNLQGGSPTGYGNKDWINSGFDRLGGLRNDYFKRLDHILRTADELGMVVVLGLFYFGQDQHLLGEFSVLRAIDNTIDWLFNAGYRNVLIEVNNECDQGSYDHSMLRPEQISKLIKRIRLKEKGGLRFLVSTSFTGNTIPNRDVIGASDFILLHGNGVERPERISEMVAEVRKSPGYRPKPIIFNEDDHYDFDRENNNLVHAVRSYASWGYFDYRRKGEDYREGYQSVPVDWGINSDRKRSFFGKLNEITGMSAASPQ